MDIVHHPEARKIADALYPVAKQVTVKSAHWITLPDGSSFYTDDGAEWCHDCGRAMLRHLKRRDRKNRRGYMLDGGWISEHETPPHCCGCHSKLDAILLTYGALEELSHFRDSPPNPKSPDQVYEVREMLVALEYAKKDDTPYVREAIKIGRRLARQLSR